MWNHQLQHSADLPPFLSVNRLQNCFSRTLVLQSIFFISDVAQNLSGFDKARMSGADVRGDTRDICIVNINNVVYSSCSMITMNLENFCIVKNSYLFIRDFGAVCIFRE